MKAPVSDASTSTMNCLLGSGWMSTGTFSKRDLSCLKAVSASGVQTKVVFPERHKETPKRERQQEYITRSNFRENTES